MYFKYSARTRQQALETWEAMWLFWGIVPAAMCECAGVGADYP
jgi:hypothetical protein